MNRRHVSQVQTNQFWNMQRKREEDGDSVPYKKLHVEKSGQCLCGDVHFTIRASRPIQSFYCHCRNCRFSIQNLIHSP